MYKSLRVYVLIATTFFLYLSINFVPVTVIFTVIERGCAVENLWESSRTLPWMYAGDGKSVFAKQHKQLVDFQHE